MKSIKAYVDKIVLSVTTVLFILLVLIIFLQVICRYVFHSSLSWSEELGRYMLVYIVFLGASYALGQGAHMNLDLIFKRFPKGLRKILAKIDAILLIIFSFVIFRYGIELFMVGMRQKSSAMQIQMSYVYIALPLSGLLLIFYILCMLLNKEGE